MASRSLGTLTLDLVAKIGGFEAGLGKAEREAERRSRAISNAINKAAEIGTAAFAGLATAGVAAFAVLNQQADKIADFQQLSEKIGDTAEAVASLKLASDVSGVSLDTIGAASIRLTASLSKTDDEAKGVGAAIKALGLNFQDFKSLSPVDQIDRVAKAMNGFADGSEKTAVAVALFGKAGAELIPFLNDLADGSERQIVLTSEQIRQADEYTKAQARLKSELETFIQFQTAQAIPTLTAVQDVLAEIAKNEATVATATDLVKLAMGAALVVFQALAVVGSDVGFVFLSVGREIGAWAAQLNALARGDLQGFRAISDAVKEDGERARAELDKFQKRVMDIGKPAYMDDEIRRLQSRSNSTGAPSDLPRINTSGLSTEDSKAAKAAEQAAKAAQAYSENLKKQLQATEDLSVAETVLRDIQAGRLKLAGGVTEQELVGIARQIDASKALSKSLDEQKKAREANEQAQMRIDQQAFASVEAMISSNQALREEIELIGVEGQARTAIEQARISSTIALKEEELAMLKNAEASAAQISALEREIVLLTQRRELLGQQGVRVQEVEEIKQAKEYSKELNTDLKRAFSDAFRDTKNPLKAFGESLYSTVLSRVSAALAESLATNALKAIGNSGGDWVGAIAKLFGGASGGFGSGAAYGNQDLGLNFEGGGYTGSGARAGGMDGKGGFMAMVHPNETVIDHTKGGFVSQSKVTVNVINQGGGSLAVTGQRQTTGADGSMNIDVMVEALQGVMADNLANGSGSLARAMEGRYGLRTAVS